VPRPSLSTPWLPDELTGDPVISDAGLRLLTVPGAQAAGPAPGRALRAAQRDLPAGPRQDDGFAVTGRAREVADAAVLRAVRAQVLTERDGKVWPGFDEEAIFEPGIESALLMLTQAEDPFPAGPTIWRAGGRRAAEAAVPSGIVF
jgi:hypothetical protein